MLESRPKIIVSKCLGIEECRYSKTMCKSKIVDQLRDVVDVIPVCPEQDIGLPTPRESLRIVKMNDQYRLIQPKTNSDFTNDMESYSDKIINQYDRIDGFILKGRSPSCGIKDVKVYNTDGNAIRDKTSGIFAGKCMEQYENLPIEDEGRLTNYKIRDVFLTKLYCIKEFRDIKEHSNSERLKLFHHHNELLFKLYNKSAYSVMNKAIKNKDKTDKNQLFDIYEEQLYRLFNKRFRKDSFKRTAKSLIDGFNDRITSEEHAFFNELLEDFENELASEQILEYILKNNLLRFKMNHYYEQSLFNKYPKELYTPSDSGK